MRKPTINREQIMEATISLVAQNGLENITTKKAALSLKISEGSVFHYFTNKKELLTECLYHIDRQIDVLLKEVPFSGLTLMGNIKTMWLAYFNYFLDHPGYAVFYRSFRFSSYYDHDVMAGQEKSFPFFSKFLAKFAKLLGLDIDIFWIFLIENTLNYAIRMDEGRLERNDKNIEKIFNIISYGIYGVFKRYKEKEYDIPMEELETGKPANDNGVSHF